MHLHTVYMEYYVECLPTLLIPPGREPETTCSSQVVSVSNGIDGWENATLWWRDGAPASASGLLTQGS
jgi:hypothetical protein